MPLEGLIYALKNRLQRDIHFDSKRHMMDQQINSSVVDIILDEVLPALDTILLYWENEPEYIEHEEPPMTMAEMHQSAWERKQMIKGRR